jgi:tetratricopeptide (TPR) repeat protein
MEKKFSKHATFVRLLSILVCIAQLAGCFTPRAVPEQRFQQASDLVDVGTRFLRERKFSDARKAFELASELAPVAAAVDGLGCVALLEGRYAQAEEYFTKAYEMDRSYDEALVNLGLAHELQGRPEEAQAIYMKYLDKNPSSAIARNNVAALEYDRGMRRMEAVEALEKAIALSNQAVIRDNLAILTGNVRK